MKKYAVFKGRAHRTEFWMFALISFVASMILGVVDGALGLSSNGSGLLGAIYSLAVLLPALGVVIRRLHDTNRSGWWFLLVLIPVFGWIALIVFYATEGDKKKNQFGDAPKPANAGAKA